LHNKGLAPFDIKKDGKLSLFLLGLTENGLGLIASQNFIKLAFKGSFCSGSYCL